MNEKDISQIRLCNTGLRTSPFNTPEAVIAHLGALQAQDFSATKWAVGLRMQNATDEIVENAFSEGKFLRTHVMRPTWHFVLPEDIRWMLQLTAPRVKKILAAYNQRLEITMEKLSKTQYEIKKVLEEKSALTRTELGDYLEQKGLHVRGQRLGHILVYAELDGLICSGPRKGKQFTYALLEERVAKYRELSQEEALIKLALKYFRSHGPAQTRDFAWWSGLSAEDANKAINSIDGNLNQTVLNGKTYWFIHEREQQISKTACLNSEKQAFLLSVFDEYVIAYRDRSDISEKRDIERLLSMGNAVTAVIVLDGKVAGTWKRILKKNAIEIKLNMFENLKDDKIESIKKAAECYGKFWNKTVSILI